MRMEPQKLSEDLKVSIMIWKKVPFEDLNKLCGRVGKKLIDFNGSRLPQGILSSKFIPCFPNQRKYRA